MTPETWNRVDALFALALGLPTAERRAYLERACRGDGALLRQVEVLLEADRANSRFLEEPPSLPDLPVRDEEPDRVGMRAGPFRLVARLGAGGMGTVYLGEREEGVAQRVAIKVLRAGAASPADLERFRREQQALARLAHDRIARFFDAGQLEDGRPFLVLEYVEGQPIDRFCDHRGLAAEGRLQLFLEVCAAVRFVHRNLLVHRDLKPENVLVTPEGAVKLLDFGIAKDLTDAASLGPGEAYTTAFAMTPRYASPEQVLGEPVSTSTDIYSLGVLLYELLCGRSPYRTSVGSRFELERAIVEQEPLAPSRNASPAALARRLAGDLDAITLRALRKEPAARYESVDDLARDLAAFLERRPVAARRGSLAYRAGKWLSRHRLAAALGGAALVFLLTAAWQTFQRTEQVRAERDKARQALRVLVETFESADPYSQGDASLTAQDLLARAQALVREGQTTPGEVEAPLLRAIGSAYVGLGFFDRAEPLLARAIAITTAEGESEQLAETRLAMVGLLSARGKEAEALAEARRALAELRRLRKPDPRLLGAALRQVGRLSELAAESEALHREALVVFSRVPSGAGPELAETRNSLARTLARQGEWDKAMALFAEAAAAMEVAAGEKDPRLAGILTDAGLALLELNRPAEARARFERALAIDREVLGPDHPDTLADQVNLGLALQYQGDAAGAEHTFREVLPRIETRRGTVSTAVANVLHNLAWAVFVQGRPAEAADLNRRALALFRTTLGDSAERVALSLRQLAIAEFGVGRDLALARGRLEEARAILEKLEGPASPGAAKLRLDLGQLVLEGGEPEAAEPLLRQAAASCRSVFGEDHPSCVIAQAEMARALVRQKRFVEAESELLPTCERLARLGLDPADFRLTFCQRRIKALDEAWGRPAFAARSSGL